MDLCWDSSSVFFHTVVCTYARLLFIPLCGWEQAMMRHRKIPTPLVNRFLFLTGSVSGSQCVWTGFGEVSRSACRLFLFVEAIANANDWIFVQCLCEPSSVGTAAYGTAKSTNTGLGLKQLLKTITVVCSGAFCRDDATTCLSSLNPEQPLFPHVGVSQGGCTQPPQYPQALRASFIFTGMEQKCHLLLLKC